MSQDDDALDLMHEAEQQAQRISEQAQRISDLNERLTLLAQLLTCAIANLGGEMAVTTTEIDRAVSGQQIALTSLPNDRGFYVALVTHDPGGSDAVEPAAPVDLRSRSPRRT